MAPWATHIASTLIHVCVCAGPGGVAIESWVVAVCCVAACPVGVAGLPADPGWLRAAPCRSLLLSCVTVWLPLRARRLAHLHASPGTRHRFICPLHPKSSTGALADRLVPAVG